MRGRTAKERTERNIWRKNIVCYPNQDGVRVITHELVIGLEEVCLEEGMLEMTREALYHEMAIKGTEESL